jgi:hypothetical protein
VPRQRFIHPAIWVSEDFNSLSIGARLTFIGLFSMADDEGRGKGGQVHLKLALFPGDPISGEQIQGWVDEIHSRGMARFFEFEGLVYYDLPMWKYYQKPQHPTPSKMPIYRTTHEAYRNAHPGLGRESDASSESFPSGIPSTKIQLLFDRPQAAESNALVLTSGNGKMERRKRTRPLVPPERKAELQAWFEKFYANWYHRHEGREPAWQAFQKLNPDKALMTEIREDLQRRYDNGKWRAGDKYIPLPATYLNQKRWRDEK